MLAVANDGRTIFKMKLHQVDDLPASRPKKVLAASDVFSSLICPTRLGKNPAHFWDQGVGFGL
jgi:hypothetical protein